MRMNDAGCDLIRRFEGLRLEAYRCSAGIWTIGYGSTHGVREGMKISRAEAESRLHMDVAIAERAVKSMLSVPVNENQFSALVSFVFNIGGANFRKSTMRAYINRKAFGDAADEFPRWVYAKGKKLAGLIERRKEERALFLRPVTSA